VVSDRERARALVGAATAPVLVLDHERRVVASNTGLQEGRRIADVEDGALVLFLGELPELSAYQELRAGFTAAVSHELRTPLARLLVLLETAALPDGDVEGLVEQARLEVEQVRELIDDVLFLGELETGREVVSLGSTPVVPVIDEVVSAYGPRAEAAEVTLVTLIRPDVELPLRPRMLRVVVENLIANSIRYAGPGATCTIEAEAGLLEVRDNGLGVRAVDLPRLFERFYRADPARTTRGTGLGLAIVKHIVTSAGGTVEATGAPGEGLAVTCRF
jgi:two-component system phosphate regulon sensor histidine kinase PhoR